MSSKFIPPNPRAEMPRQNMPDLSLAEDIICENCQNLTFEEVLLMKKVSALVSPNGKEGIVPIPTFACVACGWVNEMFRPLKKVQPATEDQMPTEPETTKPKLVIEP
jgi:hypothetical protein